MWFGDTSRAQLYVWLRDEGATTWIMFLQLWLFVLFIASRARAGGYYDYIQLASDERNQ